MEREAYEELYRLEPGHWWYQGMREITSSLLNTVLAGQTDLRILDAGCGVGGNLTALASYGPTIGLDYSPLAVTYANETHSGRLARATVERLPFAGNSFDLVTCFDVLYCREVRDDASALREFVRVVRPGKYVLVRVPALSFLRGPHDVVVHGLRRYTASKLQQMVIRVGLLPVQITYANGLLMPLIFVIRQFQNLGLHFGSVPRSDVKPMPRIINSFLAEVLKLEARWIGTGKHFPAGVSVMCLAMKPGTAEQ